MMNNFRDETQTDYQQLFNETDRSLRQFSVGNGKVDISKVDSAHGVSTADKFLKTVKFVFLFIPGVAAIHLIGIAVFLFVISGGSFLEVFPPAIGFGLAGIFLTMFGMEKLGTLKYWKVPAFVLLFSVVTGFALLPIAFYFGYDSQLLQPSFVAAIILGYLVKRMLDNSKDSN